jgi:hypothetical protein
MEASSLDYEIPLFDWILRARRWVAPQLSAGTLGAGHGGVFENCTLDAVVSHRFFFIVMSSARVYLIFHFSRPLQKLVVCYFWDLMMEGDRISSESG